MRNQKCVSRRSRRESGSSGWHQKQMLFGRRGKTFPRMCVQVTQSSVWVANTPDFKQAFISQYSTRESISQRIKRCESQDTHRVTIPFDNLCFILHNIHMYYWLVLNLLLINTIWNQLKRKLNIKNEITHNMKSRIDYPVIKALKYWSIEIQINILNCG